MSGHSRHMQFHKGISQTLIPILHQGQMCCTIAKGVNTELGGRFQYSYLILSTTLERDIDMWSPEGNKIVLMELAEPWEKGRQEASESKASTRSWMTAVVVTNR